MASTSKAIFSFICLALLLPLSSCNCVAPLYSHRTPSAHAWLASRLRSKNVASLSSARWSQLGRLPPPPAPPSFTLLDSVSRQFVNWLHQHSHPSHPRNFSITPIERPGFKSEEIPLALAAFAAKSLNNGDVLLDLQMLHGRAKGSGSRWDPYIKALPDFIFLPLFFTDLELNNIQDASVQDEVQRLRRFIESTFQSLTPEEVAGSKFTEYAWAMAVTYSSACRIIVQGTIHHVLVPFVSFSFEPNSKVTAVIADGSIRLQAIENIPEHSFLSMSYDHNNSSDLFIFRGIVDSKLINVLLFSSLLDLVDWYVTSYGALNNNKYLTLRVVQDAKVAFENQLMSPMTTTDLSGDGLFILGLDGSVNPRILCLLGSLFYAKELLAREVGRENMDITNMNNMIGTQWERDMNTMVRSFLRISTLDCERIMGFDDKFSNSTLSALRAIKERIHGLMCTSTTAEEDKAFLAAAEWDGFGGLGISESGCPSCRWQIEEMSFNDYLAVSYRLYRKGVLKILISHLSCLDVEENIAPSNVVHQNGTDTTDQFVSWMEGNGFSISEKLSITHLLAGDGKLVRGVVVLKNIRRGETLCNLPLDMGLYDNETIVAGEVDSWDRAAARLLREKAKGSSSAWASYINILPQNMTVPILLEDHELHEVQWWPVLRELVQILKRWAAMMVHSRAFTLPVFADDHYAPYVMMPYMDMINHHYHYQADWMSQPIWGGKVEIVARRDIKKGEELFASFGPRANDNLFLYYGFVLKDNPFDVAGIFASYEDGVRWFLDTWTTSCKHSVNPRSLASCKRLRWEEQWKLAKDALENVSGRGASLNREWWHLVNLWADMGYQYIPFQPGPTVYFAGITDPSLIALFESVVNNTLQLNQTILATTKFKESSLSTGVSSNQTLNVGLRSFFTCMKSHIRELSQHPVVEGHPCWEEFVTVSEIADASTWSLLVGKIAVGVRCLEVLSLFPTTIEEDEALINASNNSRTCVSGTSCSGRQTVSEHLQLTREYRYLKKLMLQEVVHKLIS
uniref:SET domain-containing protein n=1 Tax=Physcomitrium patens TaxID=3218 RepID=A0A2K1IZK4_PHYPA|nr:hypothetical protein PHYPA_022597 [Physcomitrium patens]